MGAVHENEPARSRLAELGLTAEVLTRVLLRADAEARMVTGLEPPTAEGTVRYLKTVGFLREELLPLDFSFDNYKNFCRTISPTGSFSIVTTSGDDATGTYVPGVQPSTRYAKGELTAQAVEFNAGQYALDLGEQFDLREDEPDAEVIWFLMQRVDGDTIYSELSLPTKIRGGLIDHWEERIILDPVSRQDPLPEMAVEDPPNDGPGDYAVEVSPR